MPLSLQVVPVVCAEDAALGQAPPRASVQQTSLFAGTSSRQRGAAPTYSAAGDVAGLCAVAMLRLSTTISGEQNPKATATMSVGNLP